MLDLSPAVMAAFHDQGLRALRQAILQHWHEAMQQSANLVGEVGRAAVLAEIEHASREDPDATRSDLMMLADLRLTVLANEIRKGAR